MTANTRAIMFYLTIAALLGLGIWQILAGDRYFGAGLLGGSVFVALIRTVKQRKLRQEEIKGLNPVDERTWIIAGRAAYAAFVTFIVLSALIVLGGSIWGPDVLVNPYDLLGICLSVLVLFYIVYYYYYNSQL